MSPLRPILLAVALLAPASMASAAPADPMLDSFRTICLGEPGRFAQNQTAAEQAGWTAPVAGENESLDRVTALVEKLRETAAKQNFHLSWRIYAKSFGERRLYLGFTDKRQAGKSERECTVTDFAGKVEVDEAVLTAWLGAPPSPKLDSLGVRQSIWQTPAPYPTVAFIRSQLISSDSFMAQMLAGGSMLQMVTIVSLDT